MPLTPVYKISNQNLLKVLLASTFMMLLSGCPKSSTTKEFIPTQSAQYYLQQAQQAPLEQRASWLILATEKLLAEGRIDKALSVISEIDAQQLDTTTKQQYHLFMATTLLAAEREQLAASQFQQVSNPELLKPYQQKNYYLTFADLLLKMNRFFESAKLRVTLTRLLTDPLEREENRELLWSSLLQINQPNVYYNSLNSEELNGWITLASLTKRFADEPDNLLQALNLWKQKYPSHSATTQMPIDLARAQAAKSYQATNIAIALPESGALASSARIIRDGLISALYQVPESDRPLVRFYDSTSANIIDLYHQAIAEGANFFIGPLEKDAVEQLAQLESFSVPVLTINRLSETALTTKNFYQFGLPIEDEVRQVAMRAFESGFKSAAVLVPRTNLGERTEAAFREQFEQLGGEVREVIAFAPNEDFDTPVQRVLAVDQSFERMEKIRLATGLIFEAQPRRRQDIDMVFFKANAQQARRIKPYLDFYNAQDLPMFTTSSVFSGKTDPQLDRDLNSIQFPDAPWLLGTANNNSLKDTAGQYWPRAVESNSARLFALGHDLFTIIPELNRLQNFPDYRLPGLTGNLTVDKTGHIIRELTWATMRNGRVKLLGDIVKATESDTSE